MLRLVWYCCWCSVEFPNVFLEVKVATETLSTMFTRERFLGTVGMHMEGEIVGLVKSFAAQGTLVLLFTVMRQLVVLVVTLLVEALSTDFASERFHS